MFSAPTGGRGLQKIPLTDARRPCQAACSNTPGPTQVIIRWEQYAQIVAPAYRPFCPCVPNLSLSGGGGATPT